MLYPNNIVIEKERKMKIVKEKLRNLKNDVKSIAKYWIFDRSNLFKKIRVKLHI